MAQKNRSPGANGARQQFSDHVQNAANTPKSGIAQLVRPAFADIESFDGNSYDEAYEDALTAAIDALVMNSSVCTDRPDAIFFRQSEVVAALVNVMARYLTMDPTASPVQVRKGVDRVAEHLRGVALDMVRRDSEPQNLMLSDVQGDGWLS